MSRCIWVACLVVSLEATSAPLLSREEEAEPGPCCMCIRYSCPCLNFFCLRRANPAASVVLGEVLDVAQTVQDEFFFSDLRRELLHARENLTLVDAAIRGGMHAEEASVLLKATVVDSLSRAVSNFEIMKMLTLEDATVELDAKLDFSKIKAVRDLIEEWCQPEWRVESTWRSVFNQSETALRDAAVILRGLETSTFVSELMTMKNPFKQ